MTLAPENDLWIAGAMLVWSFIWLWAAVSKWNSHFPYVIMFMMNNGPFFPKILKKRLFRGFPDDLRPSDFADPGVQRDFCAAFTASIDLDERVGALDPAPSRRRFPTLRVLRETPRNPP